jgi:hypothetical protein
MQYTHVKQAIFQEKSYQKMLRLSCTVSSSYNILEFNTIHFYLTVRPLHVEVLFHNQPLSADRQYEIECQAIGSRPPSIITWWMNGVAQTALPSKVRYEFS